MTKLRLFLARTPAAVQAQAKALLSGAIMAVVTVLIPLLSGGHLTLRGVAGAVTATLVSYLGVWWKGNGPSEVNTLLGLLVHTVVTPHAAGGQHELGQQISVVTNLPIPPVTITANPVVAPPAAPKV